MCMQSAFVSLGLFFVTTSLLEVEECKFGSGCTALWQNYRVQVFKWCILACSLCLESPVGHVMHSCCAAANTGLRDEAMGQFRFLKSLRKAHMPDHYCHFLALPNGWLCQLWLPVYWRDTYEKKKWPTSGPRCTRIRALKIAATLNMLELQI